ncbi:MAG: hypothetical protein ACYTGB_03320 [Planctomycetota bacterium]|jgi:hypothetical protein
MSWKKVAAVTAAAMLAAYFGARLASPDAGSVALAGGASVSEDRGSMVAVTTAAQGGDSNRLILVDTAKKRILVYRIHSNYMRLIAARPYKFDLKLQTTDSVRVPGNGLGYADTHKLVMQSDLKKEEKESMPRGKELVLTTDGERAEGNHVILINTTEKRILIYALNRNFIGLLSARHYEYDNYKDFFTTGFAPGDGYDYRSIRDKVELELKKLEKNP